MAGGAVGVLGVRRGGRDAVAGAAGGGGGIGPGGGIARVAAGEGAVAVDVGAGRAVPGRRGASRPGDGPEGNLGRPVRVGVAGGDDVALGAGERVAVLQVEGVGADRTGGGGGLALRAPGRRGGHARVQGGVGAGRIAVAGGAGEVRDVDLAIDVGGEVDGGRGVAGVAAAAVRGRAHVGVRSRGRKAVAGAAGGCAGLGPDRGVGGGAAHEAAVAVGGRAGGAVPGGDRSAGGGERAEGEVHLSVGVGGSGGDDVALGASDRRADCSALEVELVGADGAVGRGDFALGSFGGCGGELGVGHRGLTRPVAMAQGASFALAWGAAVRSVQRCRTRVSTT